MENTKNILIFTFILALVFVAFTKSSEKKTETFLTSQYLIYDDAVTTANDSLESAWFQIDERATQVELFLSVKDTMRIDYYIDYKYGSGTAVTLAVDSIVTTGTALTGKSKGVVLRGYGATAISNLIPGANQIRYRAYRNAESRTTGSHYAAIIQR